MRFFGNRQNDTTNTQESNSRIEYGWGIMTFAAAAQYATDVVTFQTAFTGIPIVIVTHAGDANAGTAVAYGNGGNVVHGTVFAKAVNQSTTGFTAVAGQSSASTNYPINSQIYYNWIAIGK